MQYTQSDIAALKSADVLQDFISQHEEYKGLRNGKPSFTCRIHSHKHPDKPHIRLEDHKGKAVAICDSYGVIGDIFSVCREYTGESNFIKQVEAVAAAVGYNLTPDDGTAPKKARRSRKAGFSRPLAVPVRPAAIPAVDEPLEYRPPDEEAAALAAVERLRNAPRLMADFASMLGLPLDVIRSHTDMSLAVRGLLGADERGRMVYVYTHCPDDAAPVRVHLIKYRCKEIPWPYHGNPFHIPKGSKKSRFWGADDAAARDAVWITEGESDALAVRAAVEAWHDIAVHTVEMYDPATFPAVVAKLDAGTFKEEWARPLRGKEVTLITDADKAGLDGAKKTAGILKAAGVRRVFAWMPSGVKDARAAFKAGMPHLLATDIYTKRKELE